MPQSEPERVAKVLLDCDFERIGVVTAFRLDNEPTLQLGPRDCWLFAAQIVDIRAGYRLGSVTCRGSAETIGGLAEEYRVSRAGVELDILNLPRPNQ